MKAYIRVLVLLAFMPQFSLARGGSAQLDGDLDQELDRMYSNNNSSGALRTNDMRTGASVTPNNAQPIYIVNQATPTSNNTQLQSAQQVQRQPVTLIQETPLEESKADLLRKARQSVEVQTEQKIVEKLEKSRLEDEQRRQQALFGEAAVMSSTNQVQGASQNISVVQAPGTMPITAPVTQVPVQVVQPAAQVQIVPDAKSSERDEEETRDIVREEVRNALEEKHEKKSLGIKYFSGLLGVGEYPDAQNVQGNYSIGAAFGSHFEHYAVEGIFSMANYGLNQTYVDPYYGYNAFVVPVDVNQYSGGVSLKYFLMSGIVRPVLGGVVQYSYRTYTGKTNGYGNYYPYYQGSSYGSTATSHAVDVGLVTGVDFELSPSVSLGLDFRYMVNMYVRANVNGNTIYSPGVLVGSPLEKMQYYITSLSARFSF